jgi:hypothetical protein
MFVSTELPVLVTSTASTNTTRLGQVRPARTHSRRNA